MTDAELRAQARQRLQDATLFHLALAQDPAFLRQAIATSRRRLAELAAFAAGLDEVPRRHARPRHQARAQSALWEES